MRICQAILHSTCWFVAAAAMAGMGCRGEMHNQPRYKPLQESRFFENGSSARPLVEGTIPRGFLRTNVVFFEGLAGTNLIEEIPVEVTAQIIGRGRERYDIYCANCHGFTGDGNGMIVQRGFPKPAPLDSERLRQAPAGHFYRVITYGYGVMFPQASRVPPEDRWAIVAYVRALQSSRHASISDAPANARATLEAAHP